MSLRALVRGRRREFLKVLATGMGGLVVGVPVSGGCRRSRSDGGDPLLDAFRSPSPEARPFFRWWWNGNRVTRDELIRELRLMHAVGAGGVEINPIGMHEAIAEPSGRAVEWLSDEWTGLVAAVVEEAERLGLVTDLIVGTGWPFGGEFLSDEDTIQGIELEVLEVEGPTRLTRELPRPEGAHRRLLQARLFPREVRSLEEGRDLTPDVRADGTLVFDVPAGAHRVYVLTWRNRFRDVFLGAPGGAGPVLDHFNRQAVEQYLNHTSDRLKPALGEPLGRRIRAMFCDSIELEGANWTGDHRRHHPPLQPLPSPGGRPDGSALDEPLAPGGPASLRAPRPGPSVSPRPGPGGGERMIRVDGLRFTCPGNKDETLRGLEFEIERGEIFGFLGPSGSGKSTTQKILIGLLRGFAGSVDVRGRSLREKRTRGRWWRSRSRRCRAMAG